MAQIYLLIMQLTVLIYYTSAEYPVEVSSSKGKSSSCDNYTCLNGQECFLNKTDCCHPPCPLVPACRPSCLVIRCGSEKPYCLNGKCVNSCKQVDCGPGKKCVLEQVACFTTPCPPMPTCKPVDRCALIRCKSGYKCENGSCVRTCDNYECPPGTQCVLEQVACFTTPCPPMPTCKPVDRCDLIRCKSGYKCENGSCVPTCDKYECPPGQECYLKQVQCFRAPCPLVRDCRPELTCATIKCRAGYVCVNKKCIPPTCEMVKCDPGQLCYLESKECTTPPCEPPQPVCRGSCINITCLAPSNCINGQCVMVTTDGK